MLCRYFTRGLPGGKPRRSVEAGDMEMDAVVLRERGPLESGRLTVERLAVPEPGPGQVLLRVRACGVCRTDLHIVRGELPAHRSPLVIGHQIVGDVVSAGADATSRPGARVGVSWLGGTDGTCFFCTHARENLCDHPSYTGYDVDGGYAEYVVARDDFVYPLPAALDDLHAAPLLCAGIIGFRALRVAGVQPGERVGLYGFGSSAHLALWVLRAWGCSVAVATRGERHRAFARSLGDFGATLMIAGDIPGRTQTAAIAIFDDVESGNTLAARVLVIVISILTASVVLLANRLERKRVTH